MQRSKSRDEAIANYARAVELREQLVAAEPKDESLKKDLDSLKADLEKLKSSRPVAKAAPADNGPTDGAAKPAEK